MRKPRLKPVDRSDGFVVLGYLQHYVCFRCRKTFKSEGDASKHPLTPLCPQCRTPMTNMGTDFKAPAQKNVKQWEKVRLLAQAGVKFFPKHDTELPGERPDTLAEVPAFLKKVYPPSEGERLLEPVDARNAVAPREGRLVLEGDFPEQQYSLLGRPLQNRTVLQMFDKGKWRYVYFQSKGNGNVPIRQAFIYPLTSENRIQYRPIFLTFKHRLRWPIQ